jgi:iron complex outermembrane recepter protein
MPASLLLKTTLFCLAIVSIIASKPLAAADDATERDNNQVLESITVTAQKRRQSLKDVPISVSAVNGKMMQEAKIEKMEDLSAYIPNFSVSTLPIGDKINIRGMQSGNQAGFEQSVGTFINGVYRGRGVQSRFAFADVERVEVLRGPQSILFGKNTVAGALNITTARPDEVLNGEFSLSYTPQFEQTDLQGFVTGALSESLRARIFLMSRKMDKGYIHNFYYDTNEPRKDELVGRATLEWDVSDDTLLTLVYEHSDFDYPAMANAQLVAGPLAALGQIEGYRKTNIGGDILDVGAVQTMQGASSEFSLTSESRFDTGILTFVGGYSSYDFSRFYDVDYSPLDGLRLDDSEDFSQRSAEFRFATNQGERVEYMTGLYWQQQDLKADGLSYFNVPALRNVLYRGCAAGLEALDADVTDILVPGNAVNTAVGVALTPGAPASLVNSCSNAAAFTGIPFGVARYALLDQDNTTLGLFGQGTWNLSNDFRITLGLRYTTEEKSASKSTIATDMVIANKMETNNPVVKAISEAVGEFVTHRFTPHDPGMTRKENSPTWLMNSQYDIDRNNMAYVSVSTGYKAGGYNSFYMSSPTKGKVADSEDVSFKQEEVTAYELGLKSSLFDGMADINVAAFRSEFDNLQVAIFSGNTTFEVQNAAAATSTGIELDSRWRVTPDLTLNGSLGLLRFKYDDFKHQACTNEQFVRARQAQYQSAADEGDVMAMVLNALTYNNALCASAGINDLSGKTAAQAPKVSASLTAAYYMYLGEYQLKTNIGLNYNSKAYRQDDLDPHSLSQARTLVDASLVLAPAQGKWELALIGKNLTNKQYFDFVNDTPLFPGAHSFIPQVPRSLTLSFRYKFGDY